LTNTGRERCQGRSEIGVLIGDLIALADALELSQDGFRQFRLEVPIAVAAEDATASEPMSMDRAPFLFLVGASFAGHLPETGGIQFGREIDQLGRRHEKQMVVAQEVAARPAGRTLSDQLAILLKLCIDPVIEDGYFSDDSAMSF
jgi:hypothetical protein